MKLKTNFSKESPVWLLGKCYHRRIENPEITELGTDVAAFTQSQNNIVMDLINLYFHYPKAYNLFVDG